MTSIQWYATNKVFDLIFGHLTYLIGLNFAFQFLINSGINVNELRNLSAWKNKIYLEYQFHFAEYF